MADAVDEALMAEIGERWRKVAMVLAQAADKLGWDSVDDFDRLAKRLETLVADGQLEAQGNLGRWRYSEVRAPGLPTGATA